LARSRITCEDTYVSDILRCRIDMSLIRAYGDRHGTEKSAHSRAARERLFLKDLHEC